MITPTSSYPLRLILAKSPRHDDPGVTTWGTVLECGHYVERASVGPASKGPRARCEDCFKGAPPVDPAIVRCGCSPTIRGAQDGCGGCHGFGNVEKLFSAQEILGGPPPGEELGDYYLAMWAINLDGDLLTTLIAKRGKGFIGEHTRASSGAIEVVNPSPTTTFHVEPNGVHVVRDRFIPTHNLSQRFLVEDADRHFSASFDGNVGKPGFFRRAFLELRTTDKKRVLALKESVLRYLMGEEDR